jgi:hypothetical protein
MSKVPASPVEAMIAVLVSEQGYDIELFGCLTIGRYENGQYAVNDRFDNREEEFLFDNAIDALDKFFILRQESKLGND